MALNNHTSINANNLIEFITLGNSNANKVTRFNR